MAPESNPTSSDGDKQKNLDQELRELISTLTNRLTSIHRSNKPGGSSTQNQEDDEQGVRIVTLAGSNLGATMRGDKDEKPQGLALPEEEDLATYVNSNFQAINNSIMFGGSYKTNDPGVHLDISDYVKTKPGKKGRMRTRESSKSDQNIERRRGGSKSDQNIEHSDTTSDGDTS